MLEDEERYLAGQEPEELERWQRRAFKGYALVNPVLRPVGRAGARFMEGCLSVPGYAVRGFCHAIELYRPTGFAKSGQVLSGSVSITFSVSSIGRAAKNRCSCSRGDSAELGAPSQEAFYLDCRPWWSGTWRWTLRR